MKVRFSGKVLNVKVRFRGKVLAVVYQLGMFSAATQGKFKRS